MVMMKSREEAIEDMTLMLMYLTCFGERSGDTIYLRTWKNYPFDVVDTLCDKDLIDTRHGNKSAYILDELDIKYNKPGNNIEWCKASDESDNVLLSELNINEKLIPNVRGMGARDAVFLLEERGLRVRLSGMGKVVSQNIPPGSTARKGQTITLTLR